MTEDDDALFQQEMAGVRKIEVQRVELPTRRGGPSPAQLARRLAAMTDGERDENFLMTDYVEPVAPHDILEFSRDGVQEGVYRKLRLGKYSVDAVLDLHRKSVNQARDEVFEFLRDSHQYGLRCIMILHGKGERSDPPALLKSHVNKWLPELPQVMAFHSAQQHHGGSGAVYILLRKNERQKQANRDRHSRGRGG